MNELSTHAEDLMARVSAVLGFKADSNPTEVVYDGNSQTTIRVVASEVNEYSETDIEDVKDVLNDNSDNEVYFDSSESKDICITEWVI